MLTTWRGLKAVGRRQTRVLCFLSRGRNISSPYSRVCGCLKVWVGHQYVLNVLNILSVNSTVFFIFIKHRDWNCSYKSLTDSVKPETRLGPYSWEGYTTPQLRALCSVSRHISQSLTSYSDHISLFMFTHTLCPVVAVFCSTSLKVNVAINFRGAVFL